MAWSKREKRYLLDNQSLTAKALTAGIADMGDEKSIEAVRSMCKRMGFTPHIDERKRWQGWEITYLIEHPNQRLESAANHLGRTATSIRTKRYALVNAASVRMKQITPWMKSMLEIIPEMDASIFDISCKLHDGGARISVEQDAAGNMSVFSSRSLESIRLSAK